MESNLIEPIIYIGIHASRRFSYSNDHRIANLPDEAGAHAVANDMLELSILSISS